MRKRVFILALLASLGLMAALYYARSLATCTPCADWHAAIIAGTADSPHRYRVLAPNVVQALFRPAPSAVLAAYVSAHLLVLPLMLAALYLYWRKWMSGIAALFGVAFVVAYSPVIFTVYGISLYTALEIVWLCVGLLWLMSDRAGVGFAALVAVATLNRETAVLLPLAYAALHIDEWRKPRVVGQAALYFALWAAVFVSLRLALGPAPDQITVAQVFTANTTSPWHMSQAALNNALLLPLWLAAVLGWKSAPPRLKRLALVGVPYVGLLAVFALWNETRLLLPLFVLWMPLAVRTLNVELYPRTA